MKTREMRNTSNLSDKLLRGLLVLAIAAMPAAAQRAEAQTAPSEQPPGAVGYDIETEEWLFDADDDGFPDVTERLGGTDPEDSNSSPLQTLLAAEAGKTDEVRKGTEKVGFQREACRTGFSTSSGALRLCITATQNATNYMQATANCRAKSSRLCSYEDLTYLYIGSSADVVYDPRLKWLGDFVDNDRVACGDRSITFNNDPDIWNFEGTCNKGERRTYWCCHDRL